MQAGGINMITTYVFWNVHGRTRGTFDWSGRLNLCYFIQLAKKHDMYVIVRLDPFDHGEIRNGGLSDWLYGQPYVVRSNDSQYLSQIKTLYQQISDQLVGYLFKVSSAKRRAGGRDNFTVTTSHF